MSRRKTTSDDDLLDALLPVLAEHGPAQVTFAAAAAAVGYAPATLVQRFGSRDAMIERVLLRAWDQLDAATDVADLTAAPDPAGAIALLLALMPEDAMEHTVTDGLLLLREDIRNPVLRARGAAWGNRLVSALAPRLHRDAAAGERLGWQMLRVWQGAVTWWAFTREGRAPDAIGGALTEWVRDVGLR